MVEPFRCRGHLKSVEKGAVLPEEAKELVEVLIFNLLADFNEGLKHLINISFHHGKEVREMNRLFFDPFDMGDIELEMLLEGDRLPLQMDEIIFLKGFGKGLHGGPNPPFHLPGAVDKFQSQVDISSLSDAGRFLLDQKEGIYKIIFFNIGSESLHQFAPSKSGY